MAKKANTDAIPAKAFQMLRDAQLPDMKAVAGEFFDLIGGPKAFALMLKEEFDRSPPGGQTRARIMDTVLGTLRAATAKDAPRDSSLLTDEDVDRELTSQILKMTGQVAPPKLHQPPAEAANGEEKTANDAG